MGSSDRGAPPEMISHRFIQTATLWVLFQAAPKRFPPRALRLLSGVSASLPGLFSGAVACGNRMRDTNNKILTSATQEYKNMK